MVILVGAIFQKISRSNKKQRIAKEVQVIMDIFGGTLIRGGENES